MTEIRAEKPCEYGGNEAFAPSAARQMLAAASGMVLGFGRLWGGAAPLGLALVVGCDSPFLLCCAVGAAAGSILRQPALCAAQLAAALASAVAARLLVPKHFWPGAAAGAGALLCVQLALTAGGAVTPAESLWALGTAVLALALGWTIRALRSESMEKTCLWLALLGAGAQSAGVPFWQPGITLLALSGLAAAVRGGASCGALVCGTVGFSLAAVDSSLAPCCLALGAAALLAGYLTPGDSFGGSGILLAGALAGLLLGEKTGESVCVFVSAAAALPLYRLLPLWMLEKLCPVSSAVPLPTVEGGGEPLHNASAALGEMAEIITAVYKSMETDPEENFTRVVERCVEQVCTNCQKGEECWGRRARELWQCMEKLRPTLEGSGSLTTARALPQLCGCLHPEELCKALSDSQQLAMARREERMRSEMLHRVLAEQYNAMSLALQGLADKTGRTFHVDDHRGQQVYRLFSELGLEPAECGAVQDSTGRMEVQVTIEPVGLDRAELQALADETGSICRRCFLPPRLSRQNGRMTLHFCERPLYGAVYGTASQAAEGVSGDVADFFCDSNGVAWLLLCDGMGTGSAAAVDGTLAGSLAGRMLKAGVGAEAAARLVNGALAVKSREESGATLDLFYVDLYTGRGETLKAGAAPSYLVHGRTVRPLEGGGLPLGILDTLCSRKTAVQMQENDLLVMVSDGMLADGEGWLMQQLELCGAMGSTPQEIAGLLVQNACRRLENRRADDITAMVLRLERL